MIAVPLRAAARTLLLAAFGAMLSGCEKSANTPAALTVASTPTEAQTEEGMFIFWIEHVIDDELTNGGVRIRGGDGIALVDIDRDGHVDVVTAQEDSNHLRIAYGTDNPNNWILKTIAEGSVVGAIEDIAVADLNGDGWPDIAAACEDAHLVYFENPGDTIRGTVWSSIIPSITQGRGSWLRVFAADINGDGKPDLTAANKGGADIVRPGVDAPKNGATSLITITGAPLDDDAWAEQVLFMEGIPNTALPLDFDSDGDLDVLAAKRVRQQLIIIENLGAEDNGELRHRAIPIRIAPAFEAPEDWSALANAFQADAADMNGDGRLDLILNVIEISKHYAGRTAGLGWLKQPAELSDPWLFYRIGNTLPDWVIGIHLTDIDGDGSLDVITGGYSGINVLAGTYSGASRDFDEPSVNATSSVGRIAWFQNPGNPEGEWYRHDISRRVRGMYDMFVSYDLDRDGDLDIIAPRGNSGEFDGVFWLEQVRSQSPIPALEPARQNESRHLPLPPANWAEIYDRTETYTAPNKVGR
ncbi:MAG: VCBS repeat-containing protein [Pseudomonadota bacterium]